MRGPSQRASLSFRYVRSADARLMDGPDLRPGHDELGRVMRDGG